MVNRDVDIALVSCPRRLRQEDTEAGFIVSETSVVIAHGCVSNCQLSLSSAGVSLLI